MKKGHRRNIHTSYLKLTMGDLASTLQFIWLAFLLYMVQTKGVHRLWHLQVLKLLSK